MAETTDTTLATLVNARATFGSVTAELLGGLAAWRRRVEGAHASGRASSEAGTATRLAAESWTPRPALLTEMTTLVNDGSALAGRQRALREPADVIANGVTDLVEFAELGVKKLTPWRRLVVRVQRATERAPRVVGLVQDHAAVLDDTLDDLVGNGVTKKLNLIGLRFSNLNLDRLSEQLAGRSVSAAEEAAGVETIIDGLEVSGTTLSTQSHQIGERLATATTAIDDGAGHADALVVEQHAAATQIAATNREAERLNTATAPTSVHARLEDLATLDADTGWTVTRIGELEASTRTWARAVLQDFDACIAKAKAAAEEPT